MTKFKILFFFYVGSKVVQDDPANLYYFTQVPRNSYQLEWNDVSCLNFIGMRFETKMIPTLFGLAKMTKRVIMKLKREHI